MKYTFIVKITADTNNYRLRSDIKSELERSYPDAEILDSQITPTYGQNGFAPGKFKFHMEMKYACPTEEQAKKMCKYVPDFNDTVEAELVKPEKKDTPKDKAKVKESRGRFSSMTSMKEASVSTVLFEKKVKEFLDMVKDQINAKSNASDSAVQSALNAEIHRIRSDFYSDKKSFASVDSLKKDAEKVAAHILQSNELNESSPNYIIWKDISNEEEESKAFNFYVDAVRKALALIQKDDDDNVKKIVSDSNLSGADLHNQTKKYISSLARSNVSSRFENNYSSSPSNSSYYNDNADLYWQGKAPEKFNRSMRHESKELSEFVNVIRESSFNESTYNRVMGYMDKYDTGTISAFHGHEAPNARVDNRSKSTELGKDLKALGYTYFMVGGSFMEMLDKEGNDIPENLQKNRKEWTYFVVDRNDTGKLKDDLVKLGSKYGQEAVLFSAKGSHRGQGISIANPSRTEDYGTLHHSSPNPYGDTRIRGRKYSYQ